MLRRWDKLPEFMKNDEVKVYYEVLKKKRISLILKRLLDVILGTVLLIILLLPMVIIALCIKLDSKGPILYRQIRITSYGKQFRIHKFRTMINNADKIGTSVTISGDSRITKIGALLRDYRLDELPQLIDIISGNMSFVGTRPEIEKYVNYYKPEWNATFLLPSGLTNLTSIYYKDESKLLSVAENADKMYVENILPDKMKWNLKGLLEFSFINDLKILWTTFIAVILRKPYEIEG